MEPLTLSNSYCPPVVLLNKFPFRIVIINKSNQPFLARKIHFANDIDLCVF
jgi:hypothetical protein